MADLTAEDFAQRVQEAGLLDFAELEALWSELGTRGLPLDEFISFLLRKEVLTGLQVERLKKGERYGYFYGKYKLLYLVGKGTFARVYRAAHTETGEVYAVKVLRSQHSQVSLEPFDLSVFGLSVGFGAGGMSVGVGTPPPA